MFNGRKLPRNLTLYLIFLYSFQECLSDCSYFPLCEKVVPPQTKETASSSTTKGSQDSTCIVPKKIKCSAKERFRSLDGSCNNLKYSTWGMAFTPYYRLFENTYMDGVSRPRRSVTHKNLPWARLVSYEVFGTKVKPSSIFNSALIGFGQFIAHDMSHLVEKSGFGLSDPGSCCSASGKFNQKLFNTTTCYPAVIPLHDPNYSEEGIECLRFDRAVTTKDLKCPAQLSQPDLQLTDVTHFLDLSVVYGNSIKQNSELRESKGGRLLVNKDNYLPQQSTGCAKTSKVCFKTGDSRGNQNLQLTTFQILFAREHNRICEKLAKLNPHYDDRALFEIARAINIGKYQQMVYYEYLPIILGHYNMVKKNLAYFDLQTTDKYVNDYNSHVNPSVFPEHANAAFRFFHSQIIGFLELMKENRESDQKLRLSDHFAAPDILVEKNNFDDLIRGMSSQKANNPGGNVDLEVHLHFVRNLLNRKTGVDLRTIDIHRERDYGLMTYNDAREICGFQRAKEFEDFMDFIPFEDIDRLKIVYEDPNDVDLTVGGSLEQYVLGTTVGPTFLCLLNEQFYRTRVGDRFFFEGKNAFKKDQLAEIRKASVAALFCDNGNSVKKMQSKVFGSYQKSGNKIDDCSKIARVDLSKWKEEKH